MKRAVIACLACIAALRPAWAGAQDDPAPVAPPLESLEALLDESVVTTASRVAERSSSAPATVFTITADEIRAFGMRSIDEALAYLGVGLHVQKSRDYVTGLDVGAQGIMLRDYGRHLLVLLDGHVMNSQASGEVTLHEGLGVPLEAIDHIEVMLGAGSVMYGANAMTAVVHIFTKSAERDQGLHGVAELSLAPPSGYDGYARRPGGGHELGYHYRFGAGAAHSYRVGRVPVSLAARAEWQQDLSQTYAMRPQPSPEWDLRPGETAWGGIAAHRMHAPSGVVALSAGDFTLRAQASRYQRGMPYNGLFDDPFARELRKSVRVDLSHSVLLHPTVRLRSRLYGDKNSAEDRSTWTNPIWCLAGMEGGCRYRAYDRGRWLGLEQQLDYEPRADGSLSTLFGYDLRLRDSRGLTAEYRDISSGSLPLDAPALSFAHQSVLGALFLQQLYSPSDWLTLNLGARLDMDSNFGTRLSPRAAIVLKPSAEGTVRLSYAEAFRGPTALELNDRDPTYVVRPSSLGPEVVRTAELEISQRFGFAQLALRGYVAFYEDLIDQRDASEEEVARAFARGELAENADPLWIVTNDNLNRVRSYGGSLTFQLKPLRSLTLSGSTTVSHSTSSGSLLTLWPRAFGNARVLYAFRSDGPTLGLAAAFAARRRPYPSTTEDLWIEPLREVDPMLDVRLTVASPVRAVRGLSVRGSIGTRIFADQPYLIALPASDSPDDTFEFAHDLPQLHVLLGVSYDH
jgi:outer membrane receptor for ferrienterochelin and colicins